MKVTIIIPNYNGKHFMKPCLESLSKQTFKDFKIMVIDNHSTDGSIEYMQKNYSDIELISLHQNLGFSAAVNIGIKRATTPYIILLNNDTVVDPNFVFEMVKAIELDSNIFSVSSKMIQMYHPNLIDSAGDLFTILGWGVCRGSNKSSSKYCKPDSIFSACAGAAIYRRKIFGTIGYFDEMHFAYLEDIDIGYRARIYGYKNHYCPTALVYHVGSGTSGSKYNDFKVGLSARNNIWLLYKNMPCLQLLINLPALFFGFLIKFIFFQMKGYGKQYRSGLKEGFTRIKECKKIPFQVHNLVNYLLIELQLLKHTITYIVSRFII